MSRAPVAPTGWPSAMAPPLTLSLSCGISGLTRDEHGEHLRGEGFVDFDEVGVRRRRGRCASRRCSIAKTGPRPMRAGSQPA